MRYLLLIVLLCGCSSIKEDTLIIYSIHKGDEDYKYMYNIHGNIRGNHTEEIIVRSNQKFSVGDKVQFSLKED